MSEARGGPSTKERLSSIVSGFDDFNNEMKIGTRLRREKDEYRIDELKTEMKRLDADMITEIKRRTEMNKSTQIWFEQQMSTLHKGIHETLEERHATTNKRIDELDKRITDMDIKFEGEKTKILEEIDSRGRELAKLLNEFKQEFDIDREMRLQRESVIVKQLSDHEQLVSDNFEKQLVSREDKYNNVRKVLDDNIKLRDKTSEKFQSVVEQEIHKVRILINLFYS